MSEKVFRVYWTSNGRLEMNHATVLARTAKQLKLDDRYAGFDCRKTIHPDQAYKTEEDAWLGAIGEVTKELAMAEETVRIVSDIRTRMNSMLQKLRGKGQGER